MSELFYVETETDYSRSTTFYLFLFQAYCAYDKVEVGSDHIKSVALYKRITNKTIEFEESTLLCIKWYDQENDMLFADSDKLHILLGKSYYKFIKQAHYVNNLIY